MLTASQPLVFALATPMKDFEPFCDWQFLESFESLAFFDKREDSSQRVIASFLGYQEGTGEAPSSNTKTESNSRS